MGISIITVVKNRSQTIASALESISNQTYDKIQYIIIDGGSTDGTVEIIQDILRNTHLSHVFTSENDGGVYEAINKGILKASSDVIGFLHSDDMFASNDTVLHVMSIFEKYPSLEAVYGDLLIFNKKMTRPLRYWKAGLFRRNSLISGWMPPHPALFLRSSVMQRHGLYDTTFRISADYDFILRIFADNIIRAYYLPEVLVHMRSGGLSSQHYLRTIMEDYKALKKNNIGGVATLIFKYGRSVSQLFSARR